MTARVAALVADVAAAPGQTLAAAFGLLAVCYVLGFLGWCAWAFLQDVLDERDELRRIERDAYEEHRSGQIRRRA